MTGLQNFEKPIKAAGTISDVTTMESKTQGKKHTILAVVVSSVVTGVVVLAVVISLYFGTHMCHRDRTPTREIFYLAVSNSPTTGIVVVKTEDRVIITETKTSDTGLDDTVTVQDFNRGLQAVKDVKRNQCFVLLLNMEFSDAVTVSKDNRSISEMEEAEKIHGKEAIPQQFSQHFLGGHIGEFCSGLPTFWLSDPPTSALNRSKRSRGTVFIHGNIFGIKFKIHVKW